LKAVQGRGPWPFCNVDPVRFPAVAVESPEGFRRFREGSRDLLDERYRREQALGTAGRVVELDGTCAVCLRVTRFRSITAGGEATADGRRVPNWREQQLCGCALGLNCRERAVLHRALAHVQAAAPGRVAVLGAAAGLLAALAAMGVAAEAWPRLQAGAAACDLILSADHLQHVPALDAALAALAGALLPGGLLVFTVPFDVGRMQTASDLARVPVRGGRMPAAVAETVHQVGWDVLERLTAAGFEDRVAECVWSEEFGYLGTFNLVFVAAR
jgi:SAM-dependent methyltransferase